MYDLFWNMYERSAAKADLVSVKKRHPAAAIVSVSLLIWHRSYDAAIRLPVYFPHYWVLFDVLLWWTCTHHLCCQSIPEHNINEDKDDFLDCKARRGQMETRQLKTNKRRLRGPERRLSNLNTAVIMSCHVWTCLWSHSVWSAITFEWHFSPLPLRTIQESVCLPVSSKSSASIYSPLKKISTYLK